VDHFFGFFSAFNANAIKDVQLYKGAYPAKYGGRISSVLDLTGKTGSFEKVKGGVGLNLLSANAYLQVPISKKISWLIAGRRSFTDVLQTKLFQDLSGNLIQDDGLLDVLDESEINRVQPDFYYYDWNSKLSYRPGDKDMITLSLYNGQDFLDESRSFQRIIRPDFDAIGDIIVEGEILEKTDWGNKGMSGRWSRQWSPKLHTTFLAAGSQYFSKYNRNGALDILIPSEDSVIFSGRAKTFEDNKVSDLTARFDAELLLPPSHKLEFGASVTQSKVDYSRLRDDTVTILQQNQESLYGSVYISDTWTATPDLTITAGLRGSYYEMTDQYLMAPRISAAYSISENWKVKLAAGKFYQFVNQIVNENLSEGSRDFWLLADGDLVAVSDAMHYVAGFSYQYKSWLFDVEGYYKDLMGLSEFSLRFGPGIGREPDQLFFTGNGVARGVEFLLHKRQGRYTGWLSYTLSRVTHTFPGLNHGLEFPALHDQLHEFKMVHTYEIPEWTFSANFIFGSGNPYSEPDGQYSIELLNGRELNYVGIGPKNGSRLPPYHRLDLAIHYNFLVGKAEADIGLAVFNFYGRKNVWYYEYDFTQDPVLVTELTYLGFTPNISLNVEF